MQLSAATVRTNLITMFPKQHLKAAESQAMGLFISGIYALVVV